MSWDGKDGGVILCRFEQVIAVTFKTRFLTNIVLASGVAGIVLAFAFYVIFPGESERAAPSLWIMFGVPGGMAGVVWLSVFFYRSLVLPSSVCFKEDRVEVRYLILDTRIIPRSEIVKYRSTSPSDGSATYVFEVRSGWPFSVSVESYETRRMTSALKAAGLFDREEFDPVVSSSDIDDPLSVEEWRQIEAASPEELLKEYKRFLRVDFLSVYVLVVIFLVFRNWSAFVFERWEKQSKWEHPKKARVRAVKAKLGRGERWAAFWYFSFQFGGVIFGLPVVVFLSSLAIGYAIPLGLMAFVGFVSSMASTGFIVAYYVIVEGQDFKS